MAHAVIRQPVGEIVVMLGDLGEPAVTELLQDWIDPFLTVEEQDRLLGWHLGVSL